MKTIPPVCPEPEVGPRYWRSLDQLAETPEFKAWAEREFPAGASELNDDVTRRHFVKIMSASFLLAGFGLTGCRRPEENIYPFSKMPENYVHGVPQHFATAMPTRGGAIPLVVKSHEGRPIKVEGNPQHPDSNGGTDAFAQASVLNLYDPDRAQRFTRAGTNVSRAAALDFLATEARKHAASGGAGLSFLVESSTSPSRARLQAILAQKFPQAKWIVYDAVDFSVHQRAASLATGQSVAPYFRFDKARVILSLDCDFLGAEEDNHRFIRGFASGRKITKAGDPMNRLYAIEALMTQTGANADHRLRTSASSVLQAAALLAARLPNLSAEVRATLATFGEPQDATTRTWLEECAKDLAAHAGHALVVAGQRQPLALHLLAHAINAALGGLGSTVELRGAPAPSSTTIADLVADLNAGKVETLVVLGGNPAYNAPADLNWAAAQTKAKTVVRLGYHEDETFGGSTWHLPAAHYLESWGDARTSDTTIVAIQPLIEPLFEGVTEIEVLARLAGLDAPKPHDIVRETFKTYVGADIFEEKWKRFLHDGYLAGSATPPVSAMFQAAAVAQALSTAKAPVLPGKENLEIIFTRDYSVDDGRYNNNGWLQEMPDPITKITWDNAVLLSRKTAEGLGVRNSEIVELTLGSRKITGPAWIQPGQADNSLGLALGYGRKKTGRIGAFDGKAVGFDAFALRGSDAPTIAVGAKLGRTGAAHVFACTQDHWSMEGRPIVREANLEQFNAKPDFAKNMDLDAVSHAGFIPENADGTPKGIYTHPYKSSPELKSTTHQWGMSIDLNSCVGCSACVMACQSENNIPIVSKDQVRKGREMHWIRIDRYFTADPKKKAGLSTTASDEAQSYQEWIDDPQVANQPMLCQHCESAPCESVCPVNATAHDEEGLNIMAYNRCVGTRYCSNNCAWKVRRFNFFDYNKRPLEQLYKGPLASRKSDEWELAKLVRNPEVTVRMRGVMEKCSFCLQRIEQAKIAQKVKAGASGDVEVPDGTIKTACQQACPAEAIVFGNILDKHSRVSQLKEQQRNYAVLGFLDTKPRLTYLAKVRNPNKAMPDYHVYSLEEYSAKNGDPLAEHGHGGHAAEPHAAEHGEAKGAH